MTPVPFARRGPPLTTTARPFAAGVEGATARVQPRVAGRVGVRPPPFARRGGPLLPRLGGVAPPFPASAGGSAQRYRVAPPAGRLAPPFSSSARAVLCSRVRLAPPFPSGAWLQARATDAPGRLPAPFPRAAALAASDGAAVASLDRPAPGRPAPPFPRAAALAAGADLATTGGATAEAPDLEAALAVVAALRADLPADQRATGSVAWVEVTCAGDPAALGAEALEDGRLRLAAWGPEDHPEQPVLELLERVAASGLEVEVTRVASEREPGAPGTAGRSELEARLAGLAPPPELLWPLRP